MIKTSDIKNNVEVNYGYYCLYFFYSGQNMDCILFDSHSHDMFTVIMKRRHCHLNVSN